MTETLTSLTNLKSRHFGNIIVIVLMLAKVVSMASNFKSNSMAEIEPYSFEPMRDHSDSEEGELPGNPEDSRRGNTMWCECQRCANWENQQEQECVCCHEIDSVRDRVAKMSGENSVLSEENWNKLSYFCR